MHGETWPDILKFYEGFRRNEGFKSLERMVELVRHLMANRDLRGVYPSTSLATLCLSCFKTYEEGLDRPLVTIEINHGAGEEHIYAFSLWGPAEDGAIIQEKSEFIVCSLDNSLQVYDELVGKLERLSNQVQAGSLT